MRAMGAQGFSGFGAPEGGGRYRWRVLALLWPIMFLMAGLLTLTFYPPVEYNLGDELWAYSKSKETVEEGLPRQLVAPRLFFAATGYFISFWGDGFFAARAFSVCIAALVLFVTYLLGREMADARAGFLSSLVLGTTFAFMWHSRVARHEMMSMLFVLLAFFLLYLSRRRAMPRYAAYAGLLVTLSVNVHPNNLQYVLGFLLLYPILFGRKTLSRATLYFSAGLFLGFLVWYFAAYLNARPAYTAVGEQVKGTGGFLDMFPFMKEDVTTLARRSLGSFLADYRNYVRLFDVYFPNRLSFALPAGAACVCWVLALLSRYRWQALLLLLLVSLASLANYFVAAQYGYWHTVEFFPFFAIAAVLGVSGLAARLKSRLGGAVLAVAVLFFVATGLGDTVAVAGGFRGYDYERLMGEVGRRVDGPALARMFYLPAVGKENLVNHWFKIEGGGACPPVEGKVREGGVRYVVYDDVLRNFSRLSCGKDYENELIRYLTLKCEAVALISEPYPSYWARGGRVSEVYIYRTPD
jgi:uncharacterized membrane protein